MSRRRQSSSRVHLGQLILAGTLAAGLSALTLSFAMPKGQAQVQPALTAYEAVRTQPADFETAVAPEPSQVKRASVASARPPGQVPVEERPSVRREPAPIEARPAVQARNLSAKSASAGSSPANAPAVTAAGGPYSLSLIVDDGALDGLTQQLVQRLQSRGVETRDVALEDAGRPDALLVLAQRPGDGADVWYCDPGPASSARLAGNLLASTNLPTANDDYEPPDATFPCDDVHAGRARVPAVLLELPPASLAGPADGTADRLAGAIARYFSDNAVAVKQARSAPRLVWPAKGPLTSRYGPAHPLGIDIAQWQGNIVAATDGTVMYAGGDACCGYGRYAVIDSPDGIRTLYAHFESLAVRKGQKVRQGQTLGVEGCSGHCSGPHLHFEVIDSGRRQDPMRYLP